MKEKDSITLGSVKMNELGFNLIEVMVALGILAFGILAIASLQDSSLIGSSRAYSLTDATTVAMDQMETLISCSYADPALSPGDHGPDAKGRYQVSWSVDEDGANLTKTVRVTVTLSEAGGSGRTATLTCTKNRL
ncbi:MAG: prepilin-type N-terminal cleavage/methylation domain-containing protein [Desulfobacteraceae bacterium]